MIDRAWLTVYATLADVFVLSQPYDARGGFMLLHAMDDTSEGLKFRGSLDASRRHLVAAIDDERHSLEAARRSMIRLTVEMDRLRRTVA